MLKRDIVLLFSQGVMELSWLIAGASFIMTSAVHRPFPLFDGAVVFLLAVLLTRITRERGLRVIWVLGLQALGFLLVTSRVVYSSYGSHFFSYLNPEWILYFLNGLESHYDWLGIVILVVFAFVFWLRGVALSRKTTDYTLVCSRFDLGLSVLLALFLVKFLLLVKGGIQLKTPTTEGMIYPFFIFGLMAMGFARNSGTPLKGFISGYRGIGLFLSFAGVILIFGAGLVLFFMPFLQAGAEFGYAMLKSGAEPLGRVLVCILRFLFAGAKMRSEPPAASFQGDGDGPAPSAEGASQGGWLEEILGWVLLVFGVIVLLFLLGLGLWYLVAWLFSRTPGEDRKSPGEGGLSGWFRRLRGIFISLGGRLAGMFKGCRDGLQFFHFLMKWGGRSGVPRLPNETPSEYGRRLKNRFPPLGQEISFIVDAFNLEAYREDPADDVRMKILRLSLIHISEPTRPY